MLLNTIAEKHPNSFVLLLPKTRDELVVPPNESAKFVRVYYSMLTIARVVLHIPLGGVE